MKKKWVTGNQKGFTLLELVITIAIMAILASVIGMVVTQYVKKARNVAAITA